MDAQRGPRALTSTFSDGARGMKKLLGIVVIAFIVFYLFSQPHNAADAVRAALTVVKDAFDALVTFFTALVR
jgi:hypothetical protein